MRDWVTNVRTTYYLLGSAVGPHPYPTLVRDLQSVIGREAREQMLSHAAGCPIPSWRAWAAGAMPSARFSRLSMTHRSDLWVWKLAATESKPASTPRR